MQTVREKIKNVIITGGTRGIGKELALKFKKEGYGVIISYVNNEAAAESLEKEYGILSVRADSSKSEDVKKLFAAASKTGVIEGVICNAGVALDQKPVFDVSDEELDKVINVNLKGAFFTVKEAALNLWQTGGKIVTVSSVWGISPAPCEAAYAMTKSGVIALTKSVAAELYDSGVIACSVALGLIDTDMNAKLTDGEKLEFVRRYGLNSVPTAKAAAEKIYEKYASLKKGDGGRVFKIFC